MYDINNLTIAGRLTKDPETKTLPSGTIISEFTIANNTSKDKANFIDCKAFKGTAEFVEKFFGKGDMIIVVGQVDQERWEKDGKKQSRIKIWAKEVGFGGSKSTQQDDPF